MRSFNIVLTVLPYFFTSSLAVDQRIADLKSSVFKRQSSVLDVALATPELSKLVEISEALDVTDLLGNCALGPFTVFAPTDAAFKDFGEDLIDALIADTTSDVILDIFSFHVLIGRQFTSSFTNGNELSTFGGQRIKITSDDEGTTFKLDPAINDGRANIVSADIEACNGVIHII